MNQLILIFGITFLSKALANQQLISVLPAGTVGVGGQSLLSGIPFTTANGQQIYVQQQPSVLQLVRQPSGLTQVLGQPSVTQLVGGQGQPFVTGVDGLTGVGQPLIITTNGAGLSSLPYPYTVSGLSTANLNGVPVIVNSSPVGFTGVQNTGIQTIPLQPQFVQQPFYGTNPVIRQVNEQEISPIDAALLDMENKGMMHSEQYAWGRSSAPPTKQPPSENVTTMIENNASPNEQRSAEMPIYYPLPTGIAPPSPTIGVRTPPNPFVNGAGKRRKHFELYQYYRNMDMNTPRLIVPFQ